ncbi:MAG: VOC family protein [Gammaproteobacteria bacterium]|nr:VOC family protein [Gammaproteobacteria bacterium]
MRVDAFVRERWWVLQARPVIASAWCRYARTAAGSRVLGATIADRDAGDGSAEYQQFGDTRDDLHIEVQKVEHPSRVHLDIEADDIDAEADRLETLGAKRIGLVKRWWVMEAPTGQRFCVVRMHHPEHGAAPNVWD